MRRVLYIIYRCATTAARLTTLFYLSSTALGQDGSLSHEVQHGRHETGSGQDVVLQLDVVDPAPLRVHHQEGVVQILFRRKLVLYVMT